MKKLLISSIVSSLIAGSLFAGNVASVNGENITEADINAFLAPIAKGAKFEMLPKEAKEKLINQIIEKKLLTKYATKSGIQNTKEFKETLESLKDDLSLELWMKKEFDKVSVSDKDAQSYYKENKEASFKQEAKVKARHILVKTEEEAKEIIAELKKAKDLKEKFITLAKDKSTGPSGANGGDLGFFSEKQMVPEFSKEAFSLKVGDVSSKPVKTQFGYHVIFVEDKQKGGYVAFEEIKDKIKQAIQMEKFKESTQKKAKELKSKAKIEIKID